MKTIILTFTILFAAVAMYGQTHVEFGDQVFQFSTLTTTEGRSPGVEGFSGRVVTGRPFSGIEERHSTQTLGDGTHIETSETNKLFRDDQGRTRLERKDGSVTIVDPVAGFTAELNPASRTASKTVRVGLLRGIAPGELSKLQAETAARLSTAQAQYTERAPQVLELKRLATSQPDTVTFTGPQSSSANTFAPVVAVSGNSASVTVLRVGAGDNGSVESLPAQMINGALAQGTRTTETIPVGKIGNDRAISIVNERWFSDDLQMLVKSSSSDPRFGESVYQLSAIVQASPDPSLFQIPSDYTIRK
jgi:hypothetical protein